MGGRSSAVVLMAATQYIIHVNLCSVGVSTLVRFNLYMVEMLDHENKSHELEALVNQLACSKHYNRPSHSSAIPHVFRSVEVICSREV